MAKATADVQSWIAALRAEGTFDDTVSDAGWRELADSVRTGSLNPQSRCVRKFERRGSGRMMAWARCHRCYRFS
jgi:hypothetical protein